MGQRIDSKKTSNKRSSSNFKKDGYRTKRNIKSILEKKRKRNLNTNWRVRDKNNSILGFIKAYNREGLIMKIDKSLSYTENSSATFIISHPFIKEKYEINVIILWRHKVNEILDEIGVILEGKNKKLEKLFNELETFYPNTVDTIGTL